ncbi:DNA-processing protein DprA, partial [Fictibacillus arsenicus]
HRAALSTGGSTIAVLAGGIDRNYPRGNTELLDTIRAVGAVVSEQPPGAAPTRSRFLARSRVLAALSAATIVPEAGARSGALVTTEHALRLGRGVGAVPGPVTSAASTGPHMLIQDRHATLVTSALDAQALMDRPGSPQSRPAGRTATGSSLDLEQARAERDEPGRR